MSNTGKNWQVEEYLESVEEDESIDEDFKFVGKKKSDIPLDEHERLDKDGRAIRRQKNEIEKLGKENGKGQKKSSDSRNSPSDGQRSRSEDNKSMERSSADTSTVQDDESLSQNFSLLQKVEGTQSPHVKLLPHVDTKPFQCQSPESMSERERLKYKVTPSIESHYFYDELEMMKHGYVDKQGHHSSTTFNDPGYQGKRKIGEKPKTVIWMKSAKIDDKGIFSEQEDNPEHIPYDELALKLCGFIDGNCHHATTAECQAIFDEKRPHVKVEPQVEPCLIASTTAISPTSEIVVSLRDAAPKSKRKKSSKKSSKIIKKLAKSARSTSKRNAWRKKILSVRGKITIKEKNSTQRS